MENRDQLLADRGHDDEQSSPEQLPTETEHYPNGNVKYEIRENPDGVKSINGFYATGEPEYEKTENPDGSWLIRGFYKSGELDSEGIKDPDGTRTIRGFHESGLLDYEETISPNGVRSLKKFYERGMLMEERLTNPEGASSIKSYFATGAPEYEEIRDANGVWAREFSPSGLKRERTIDPEGNENIKEFSRSGHLESETTTDPEGQTIYRNKPSQLELQETENSESAKYPEFYIDSQERIGLASPEKSEMDEVAAGFNQIFDDFMLENMAHVRKWDSGSAVVGGKIRAGNEVYSIYMEDYPDSQDNNRIRDISLQRIDRQRRGREYWRYELSKDGVVTRYDKADVWGSNQLQLSNDRSTPHPHSAEFAELIVEEIASLKNEIENRNLEKNMGLNDQPVLLAEISGLAGFIAQNRQSFVGNHL